MNTVYFSVFPHIILPISPYYLLFLIQFYPYDVLIYPPFLTCCSLLTCPLFCVDSASGPGLDPEVLDLALSAVVGEEEEGEEEGEGKSKGEGKEKREKGMKRKRGGDEGDDDDENEEDEEEDDDEDEDEDAIAADQENDDDDDEEDEEEEDKVVSKHANINRKSNGNDDSDDDDDDLLDDIDPEYLANGSFALQVSPFHILYTPSHTHKHPLIHPLLLSYAHSGRIPLNAYPFNATPISMHSPLICPYTVTHPLTSPPSLSYSLPW